MGGGVMRAAAKVAGGGLRGFAADHHPLSSAVRRSVSLRPAASTTEDVRLVASNSVDGSGSEMEDWVFAGEEEVLVGPIPRIVFGGVPSRQEAEEATSELSAALERAYHSSVSEGSDSVVNKSYSSLSLSNTQHLENPLIALPAPAVTAFRFLSESPKAKSVVASVASDPNVWNAVLQNHEFRGYLESQGACLSTLGVSLETDSISGVASPKQPAGTTFKDHPSQPHESTTTTNEDLLQKIRNAVVGMMSTFSDYFKNFFGGKASDKASPNARESSPVYDEAMKIFGLAVIVVSVIVLKRAF